MRYIDKSTHCEEFEKYLSSKKPKDWNEFNTNIKLKLHNHLYNEQGGLCIYCQQKLPRKEEIEPSQKIKSHIEHIRPRKNYSHLTFDYYNLSISCEGFDCTLEPVYDKNKKIIPPKKEFCEHRKNDQYNEELFLNPVEVKDIEDYFMYDDFDFTIYPNPSKNEKDKQKAKHTTDTLYLNHPSLVKIREKFYKDYVDDKYPDLGYENHPKILPPFYSMLRQFIPNYQSRGSRTE